MNAKQLTAIAERLEGAYAEAAAAWEKYAYKDLVTSPPPGGKAAFMAGYLDTTCNRVAKDIRVALEADKKLRVGAPLRKRAS